MKIVVTGLIATYPLGGVSWDYLAYVARLRRLGHEVFYLEDTGQWVYDPRDATFTEMCRSTSVTCERGVAQRGEQRRPRWSLRGPDGDLSRRGEGRSPSFCRRPTCFSMCRGACWLREATGAPAAPLPR